MPSFTPSSSFPPPFLLLLLLWYFQINSIYLLSFSFSLLRYSLPGPVLFFTFSSSSSYFIDKFYKLIKLFLFYITLYFTWSCAFVHYLLLIFLLSLSSSSSSSHGGQHGVDLMSQTIHLITRQIIHLHLVWNNNKNSQWNNAWPSCLEKNLMKPYMTILSREKFNEPFCLKPQK